jgi:hypothetical protein
MSDAYLTDQVLTIVYGPFGQSSMHSTLDFCPRQAKKDSNVPLQQII